MSTAATIFIDDHGRWKSSAAEALPARQAEALSALTTASDTGADRAKRLSVAVWFPFADCGYFHPGAAASRRGNPVS
jgi:hypothetical protein